MAPRLHLLRTTRLLNRSYATASSSSTPPHFRVFDRRIKEAQRTRAALSPHSRTVDYLRDTIASRLAERLLVSLPPLSSYPPHPTSNIPRADNTPAPPHSRSRFRRLPHRQIHPHRPHSLRAHPTHQQTHLHRRLLHSPPPRRHRTMGPILPLRTRTPLCRRRKHSQ